MERSAEEMIAYLSSAPNNEKIQRIFYDVGEHQFGELLLPDGHGPHKVIVLVHGGCWLATFPGKELLERMAVDLSKRGYAVWNMEYRRIGHQGGGYPGTFLDVANGFDHLKELATKFALDLTRIVAVGHSAGAHLALWAAARSRLSKQSPLYGADPLKLQGVVSLGGLGDLEAFKAVSSHFCGPDTIDRLVGADTAARACVYADTSPAALLPIGVKQTMIHGVFDAATPPYIGKHYSAAARAAGETVDVLVLDGDHFSVIDPNDREWPKIIEIIERYFS